MSQSKLVRDLIPEIIRSTGVEPQVRVVRGDEYREHLCRKLSEEVREFLDSYDPEELADVLEVLLALADNLGVGRDELEARRSAKAEARGGFAAGIVWSGNAPRSQSSPAYAGLASRA
jgi:predicted house-cleaning noncanonical NTP pyrophosphatase (MazG superfamily)